MKTEAMALRGPPAAAAVAVAARPAPRGLGRTRPWAASVGATLLLVTGLSPIAVGSLFAQTAPPPPLPARDVSFPAFSRTRLSNGAELIVVEHHEQPFVSVSLVVRGGAVADPEGLEGTAEMVANLLTRGTRNRSGTEVASAVEQLGATLQGSVGLDWTTVGLEVLSPSLADALVLMADVVRFPTFPADEVEQLRGQMRQGLQLAEGDPTAIAGRQFVRSVFAGHPYGRLATEESLRAITRGDLVAYHERVFRPEGAVFVVSGDVSVQDATDAIERVFWAWEGTPALSAASSAPVPRAPGRQVVLVDVGGASQASVVVGRAFPSLGEDEDAWAALEVAAEMIGGSTRGRLFRSLREEHGWTYAVAADAGRRIGPGLFRVDALVRAEAIDSVLLAVFDELDRIVSDPLPTEELDEVRAYLSGSAPLRLETPQQIAGQILRYHLLGLDVHLPESYRSRVSAVGPRQVRTMAAHAMDPSDVVVVVVGDADVLRARLAPFGPVELRAVDGALVTDLDPNPSAAPGSTRVDASGLPDGRWVYEVRSAGRTVGEMIREITRDDGPAGGTMTVRSAMELGPLGHVRQTVTFDPTDFRPLAATVDRSVAARVERAEVRVVGDSILGSTTDGDGTTRAIANALPEGAVIGEMQEVALWAADLSSTRALSVVVAGQTDGTSRVMRARVLGEREITVPAGTFQVWEVEFQVDGPPQRAFLSREAPHLLVRLGGEGAPLTVELRSAGGR